MKYKALQSIDLHFIFRHAPGANYLPVNVDTGPANKGGIRCPPAGGGGGQPSVSLANLSVGRSSSPAAAMAAAMRQVGFPGSSSSSSSSSGYSSTNHRPPGQQQPSANDQGPVRYVYPQPTQQQQQQYASMQQQQQQRDPGSVFVRNPVSRRLVNPWPRFETCKSTHTQMLSSKLNAVSIRNLGSKPRISKCISCLNLDDFDPKLRSYLTQMSNTR